MKKIMTLFLLLLLALPTFSTELMQNNLLSNHKTLYFGREHIQYNNDKNGNKREVVVEDFIQDLLNHQPNKYALSIGDESVNYLYQNGKRIEIMSIGNRPVRYTIDRIGEKPVKYISSIGNESITYLYENGKRIEIMSIGKRSVRYIVDRTAKKL